MQNGWLRANERKLDAARAPCSTGATFSRGRRAPLPAGGSPVTVPLYYEGHAYRGGLADPDHGFGAGRRPAGVGFAQPAVGHGDGVRSRTRAVPLAAGAAGRAGRKVPTPLPPCPGLRGEPCRAYQAFSNRAVRLTG